jgi:hypothetical protein
VGYATGQTADYTETARTTPFATLLLVALAFLLLDAFKPLHVDDTAYYFYARQAAAHPEDPHGFFVFWYERPQPATEILVPPVLPYWLAPAVRLFGERPLVWKLWLYPFCVLLTWSLHDLAKRFAPGLQWPLVMLTLFSPVLLPGLNLMLDVPALALHLGAQSCFMRASAALASARSPRFRRAAALLWTVSAGLCVGLAAETKYTGLIAPVAMLLYALLFRRLRLWTGATLLGAALFLGWELFTAVNYGQSHFLRQIGRSAVPLPDKLELFVPFFTHLGGLAPGVALAGLLARGAAPRRMRNAALAIVGTFAVVAVAPEALYRFRDEPDPFRPALTLGTILFGTLGVLTAGIVGAAALALVRARPPEEPAFATREGVFVALWLAVEVACYFLMSPYPAARRLSAVVVVSSLVVGRLAARSARGAWREWGPRLVALQVAVAALFWAVDLREAVAQRTAVRRAAEWIHEHDPGATGTTWFAGHWGFQYYAGRAGMMPVVSRRFAARSLLRAGDWLVMPDARIHQQEVALDAGAVTPLHEVHVSDAIPLRTLPGFYIGSVPLDHLAGPRVAVTIYAVTRDFVP